MNKSIKIILGIVILILVAWGLSSITKNNNKPVGEKQTVKIGIILPLTGPVAMLGEPSKKAAELALKDAGTNTKFDYELVFEDSQFDPTKAVTAASKLINVDKVMAIINFGSGTGNAINAIAENGKTVQVSLASDPTIVKGDYNFIHWTPPFKEGELLAKELIKKNYKKVSIVEANHPGAVAVVDAIKKSLNGSSVSIVSDDVINIGARDFKTIITKIKTANPDIIILEMFSPEIELIAQQMKELGLNKPVTSVEAIEWSSNPSLFEGSWFIADSVVPNFSDKFFKAYGTQALAGSSYTYDLVDFFIKTQEKQKEVIKPSELPTIINKIGNWKSSIFGNVPIDNDGFFITDASVKIIKDGKVMIAQ
jgi:branched-chain amino acid transport system substrate-binding protein